MTSVSSKFWWSQPINEGGRKGGGWEACAQPPAKTQAEVFVFGDGIRLPCSSEVSTLLLSFKWRMWLTSYLYTTVRIIWFFSFDPRRWPSLAAAIIFQGDLFAPGVYFCSHQGRLMVLPLPVQVVHLCVAKQVNPKTQQRFPPQTFFSKTSSFCFQGGIY